MKPRSERVYSAEQLAIFAANVGKREAAQPTACTGGVKCWVVHGPPALRVKGYNTTCVECQGRPQVVDGRSR